MTLHNTAQVYQSVNESASLFIQCVMEEMCVVAHDGKQFAECPLFANHLQ